MRFRGTALLFVLLAVLAAWVYLTDIRGREEREQAAEDATKVLPVDPEEIDGITLTYPDITMAAFRREDGWEFSVPPNLEADFEEWDRLSANVGRVERGDVVSTDLGSLDAFGLEDPVLRVGIEMSGGRTEEILFGGENPGGTDNYVKLASSDEVFLSPTTWLTLLRKELDDLRDKTLLRFEEASLDRIEISSTNVSLRREGDSWRMETPLQTAADEAEVRAFLSTLRSARATGFADVNREPSATGLDRPSLSVLLHDGERDTNHVLHIGASDPESTSSYYARDESRDVVFIVGEEVVEGANRSNFDWRDKRIMALDRSAVTGIEIEGEEGSLAIRAAGDGWLLDDGRRESTIEVSGILSSLEFTRATEIIDSPQALGEYGLDPPRLRVALRAGEGDPIRFAFGAPAQDETEVFWKADDQAEVKVVPNTLLERFSVSAEDVLEDAPDPQLEPSAATP